MALAARRAGRATPGRRDRTGDPSDPRRLRARTLTHDPGGDRHSTVDAAELPAQRADLVTPRCTHARHLVTRRCPWYRCPHRPTHWTPGTDRCECGRLHAATIEHAVWEQVTSLIGNPRHSKPSPPTATRNVATTRSENAPASTSSTPGSPRPRPRSQTSTPLYGTKASDPAAARGDPPTQRPARISAERTRRPPTHPRQEPRRRRPCDPTTGAGGPGTLALEEADATVRRKVIDLLDIHVHIVQWEPCDTCAGKGLLAASGPRRRNVGAPGYQPRKPTLCPDCLRTRQIPVVRVSGHVPELLVAALAEGAEIAEITPDVGPVFSFQAVVRVA